MNWTFRQPIFTSITNLSAAVLNGGVFELNWVYPTDFNDWSTHDPSTLNGYRLYRHVEIKYPSVSANGGPLRDPSKLDNIAPEPQFKLIAELGPTEITYLDDLTDLSMHEDEGIVYDLNTDRWVDGAGNDIIQDILNTDRRLYYKITASSNNLVSLATPFMYMVHTDGVECRSTCTQVKWNTLYNEGDTVWFNSSITNRNRTSVDPIYEEANNRYLNVWVSGNDNTIYRLDGRDGSVLSWYTLPFVNIHSIRVDPTTGDLIVAGDSQIVYRCVLGTTIGTAGTIKSLLNTTTTPFPNGNNGMVLTFENDDLFSYIIANEDVVPKCNIDNLAVTEVIPRTQFGCTSSTNVNIPNLLGITNGPDNGVWVNAHVPIHYRYSTSVNYWERVSLGWRWSIECRCPDGTPCDWAAAEYGGSDTPVCDSDHFKEVFRRVPVTYSVLEDHHFLQDIGYLYGVTTGQNKSVSNQTYQDTRTYPCTASGYSYYPFTSRTNRSGYVGSSDVNGSPDYLCGRPWNGLNNTGADARLDPNPAISQKGIATDTNLNGSLDAADYNVWQVNEYEDKVHRLSWLTTEKNGTTPHLHYADDGLDYEFNITNPVHVAVDSDRNVWVIQESTSNQLTKIYQLYSTTDFTNGGNCRWPELVSLTANNQFGVAEKYVYGNGYSDPYIEFYLTRNISFTPAQTALRTDGYRAGYGTTLSGDIASQKLDARTWSLIGTNYLTQGKRLYPNYTARYSMTSFSRLSGDTTEYNSDNFGTCYLNTVHSVDTYPDYIHPEPTYPVVELKVFNSASIPQNCDSNFWIDQNMDGISNHSTSGYDSFQVLLSAGIVSMGTFFLRNYQFYYDDKVSDVGTPSPNPISISTPVNTTTYIYHDPSISGKPNNRHSDVVSEPDGKHTPYCILQLNANCYTLSGEPDPTTRSNDVEVVAWERWPTARFYVEPHDTADIRQNYLAVFWNLTSFNFPVGTNGLTEENENRIVSGYDPLSAVFNDWSITRTWPLTAWYWTYGDSMEYGLPFARTNSDFGITYPHVTSDEFFSSTPPSQRDDCATRHYEMTEHLYKGPGTYYSTLWVVASNTGTDSWNISAGVTDQNIMVSSFVVAATRRIDVLEVCPNTEYWYISSYTVQDDYSDDAEPVFIAGDYNTSYDMITGYAPHLTIKWEGSVTGRSLPISSIWWNFGDPYVNILSSDYTYYAPPLTGWPIWTTESYDTTGVHTFVMPGLYNVTLVPMTSSPNPNYVRHCEGLKKELQVYVKELLIQPCFTNSYDLLSGYNREVLSGVSPVSIYFNPSCTVAGSFPICRIDWDFGDGTPVLTISRQASSLYGNYYNSSSYMDPIDPRNVIVWHTYDRTYESQVSTFTAMMSVYACNTNTMSMTSIPVGPIELATLSDVEGEVHLIENRMYHPENDLLLTFEGQKSLNSYTVLLSTERF